jgi:hypothetical protein
MFADRPGKPTTPALLRLSAPHLPMLLKAGLSRRGHATHASFSSRGDKLVASYHGDHAYVFDITGRCSVVSVTIYILSAAANVGVSSRGDELVATYHGDNAYVYDITGGCSVWCPLQFAPDYAAAIVVQCGFYHNPHFVLLLFLLDSAAEGTSWLQRTPATMHMSLTSPVGAVWCPSQFRLCPAAVLVEFCTNAVVELPCLPVIHTVRVACSTTG